jgi:imidazolonepropionase-like amidohydrolase
VDVVWRDGRIVAAGADAPTEGCTIHPAAVVTPGLVALATPLGLVEVELESSTRDDQGGPGPIRAAFRVADAYDPRSVVVPVTRSGGITAALVVPDPAIVAGPAAAVRLVTGTQAEAAIAGPTPMVLHPGQASSFASGLATLRAAFADARWIAAGGPGGYARVEQVEARRADLVALGAWLASPSPTALVHVDKAADIEAVLRLAAEERFRPVIVGGAEAWILADALAAARVPVLVDPFVYGPGSFDQLRGRADNAARLVSAGVKVGLLAGGEPHNARAVRFVAGNAVRAGLPPADALRAVTSVPAEVLGWTDRGVVRVGAVADLALWTGDPLDTPGRLAGLWIGGVEQPRETRQTALVDAWRELPRDRLPDLPAGAVPPSP